MTLLPDGAGILLHYWRSLVPLIIVVLGFGSLGVSLLPGAAADRKWLTFPLSLGIGVILLTLCTYILFLASLPWRSVLGFGAYVILVAGAICFTLILRHREGRMTMGLGLPVLLLVLTARLPFVRRLSLPPYSDSPTHYMIVLDLLEPSSRPDALYSFGSLFQHYYHFGVHCLTAWVALVSQEASPLLLAVMGQFLLSIVPFSVFALAGTLTEGGPPAASRAAAWVAGLVSAIGWWMPAYAANWAKYPTLAALAVLPIPLAYLHALKEKGGKRTALVFSVLLTAGVMLLHSRTIIVIALALAAYFLARLAVRGRPNAALAWAVVAILLTAALAYLGWLNPDVASFYADHWVLLACIAVLLPAAAAAFPEPTFAALLTAAGMILLQNLPAPLFLANHSFALLDRPFVQTALYLPLAALAGLGIAGVGRWASRIRGMSAVPAVVMALLVMVSMPPVGAFYPDSCCSYASGDDVGALEWLQRHASQQALVLIAGMPTRTRLVETDAGTWVYALTRLDTAKRSFNSTIYDAVFVASACQGRKEVYLYGGGGPMSFEIPPVPAVAANYDIVYTSGKTRILLLKVCAQR